MNLHANDICNVDAICVGFNFKTHTNRGQQETKYVHSFSNFVDSFWTDIHSHCVDKGINMIW